MGTSDVTESFRWTQSLIVLCVVVGSVIVFLLVANVVIGMSLLLHHRERKRKRRSDLGKAIQSMGGEEAQVKVRARGPLPGMVRVVYRRPRGHGNQTASIHDDQDTVAFNLSRHDGELESTYSFPYGDAAGDELSQGQRNDHLQSYDTSGKQIPDAALSKHCLEHVRGGQLELHTTDGSNTYSDTEFTTDGRHNVHVQASIGAMVDGVSIQNGMSSSAWVHQFTNPLCKRHVPDEQTRETIAFMCTDEANLVNHPKPVNSSIAVEQSKSGAMSVLPIGGKQYVTKTANTSSEHIHTVSLQASEEIEPCGSLVRNISNRFQIKNYKPSLSGKLYKKKHERFNTEMNERTGSWNREKELGVSMANSYRPSASVSLPIPEVTEMNVVEETTVDDSCPTQIHLGMDGGNKGLPYVDIRPLRHGQTDVVEGSTDVLQSERRKSVHFETSPRSPVLDWSISDDDKHSYFSQDLPVTKIEPLDAAISLASLKIASENQKFIENIKRFQNATYQWQIYRELPDVMRVKTKTHSQNNKMVSSDSVRIVKTPVRKRSFMHRLLNRQKQTQNNRFLKTYYSEDMSRINIDYPPQVKQQKPSFKNRQHTQICDDSKAESLTKGPIEIEPGKRSQPQLNSNQRTTRSGNNNTILKSTWNLQNDDKYNAGNTVLWFHTPRFTLSEDDLCMYPDNSVPTIEELVRNGTNRRKKNAAAIRHNMRRRHNDVTSHMITTHAQRLTPPPHGRPKEEDDDVYGFHTGVSDKYHSISGRQRPSLGEISFQPGCLDAMPVRHRLAEGPIYTLPDVTNDETEHSGNVTTRTTRRSQKYQAASNSEFGDDLNSGAWKIGIVWPQRSNSIKEVDSVSSFALSDFDMGESDVDDMGQVESGDEQVRDQDHYDVKEDELNHIKDIRF